MSTPVIVAAIVGAFVLGLLLGAPMAIMMGKRRLRAAVSAELTPTPVEMPTPAVPEPTLRLPRAERQPRTEYVITSAGEGDPDDEVDGTARMEFKPRPQFEQVARTVMIEAASLAHGVRNALSEENRAKISYEIKRELIRVRKDRKIEVKEALREYRAKHRAPIDAETGEGE
jgi:hypothetical protein